MKKLFSAVLLVGAFMTAVLLGPPSKGLISSGLSAASAETVRCTADQTMICEPGPFGGITCHCG